MNAQDWIDLLSCIKQLVDPVITVITLINQ